jgi:hypothetical protein
LKIWVNIGISIFHPSQLYPLALSTFDIVNLNNFNMHYVTLRTIEIDKAYLFKGKNYEGK